MYFIKIRYIIEKISLNDVISKDKYRYNVNNIGDILPDEYYKVIL